MSLQREDPSQDAPTTAGAAPDSRKDESSIHHVAIPPQSSPMLSALRNQLAQPIVASFLAGGVAGAVSRTLVSPLERLKILLQIQSTGRTEYKMSMGKALKKMWSEEGWRGFMRGNGTNCIRIVPYSAVQYGSYSFYRRVRLSLFAPSFICAD